MKNSIEEILEDLSSYLRTDDDDFAKIILSEDYLHVVNDIEKLFSEQKAELLEQLIKVTNALEKTNGNSSEGNAIVLGDAKAVIAKHLH